jgi:hypothetical protein
MTDTDANAPDVPDAPESLPNYIADGLPKQDDDTLHAVREYVDELLASRAQSVPDDVLPDDAEPTDTDDDGGRGTLVKEKVKCGDESCECMDGGDKHGPYLYRYFYENGSLNSEYVGKP